MIVVDNNSTDATRDIVEQAAGADRRVRYAFEARQGLSYARTTGIAAARASLVAFTDDDVRVEPDWVAAIVRAFDEHPKADLIGGRVLPIWPSPPAAWLTRDHWAPLALLDHGDAPIAVTTARPICLIGANVAFRREVFEAVGEFDTDFQRSEDMERTRGGTLLGVPLHLYRQAVRDAIGWMRTTLTGDSSRAFAHELRLRFFNGFFSGPAGASISRGRVSDDTWQ